MARVAIMLAKPEGRQYRCRIAAASGLARRSSVGGLLIWSRMARRAAELLKESVREGRQYRCRGSCGSLVVLVDEAAEPVAAVDGTD